MFCLSSDSKNIKQFTITHLIGSLGRRTEREKERAWKEGFFISNHLTTCLAAYKKKFKKIEKVVGGTIFLGSAESNLHG